MNEHPWQQPLRPMDVYPTGVDVWRPVLFVRPRGSMGWEAMTTSGNVWNEENSAIRISGQEVRLS